MRKTWLLILLVLSLWGCTSFSGFYKLGNEAEMNKDWDKAIEYYQKAIIEDPTEPSYRYSLTRAKIAASFYHLGEARKLAAAGKTDEAAKEYERSLFYDPQNRLIAEEMKRITQPEEIKEEPKKEKLEYPVKLKVGGEKIDLKFTDASLRSIFQALGKHAQINIIFDELFKDMPVTIDLTGKEFEEAVSYLCLASKNFYRIVDERTLIIVPDQPVKRIQYEQNAIKVFYLSNINVQDIFAPLTQMLRTQYRAPNIFADKNLNTITVRDTPSNIEMAQELIMKWDKPKGEVIVEIEIMEVNRQKLREMGVDYSALATGLAYAGPGAVGTEGSEGWFILGQLDFTTADSFAITLPTAFLRYLETDADTKILAQPKLRGLADEELRTLVGQKIPLPQTTFQPIAAGGVSQQPVVSYTYEDVGLDIKVKPRLHLEKEITLEIELKLSSIIGEGFAGIPIIGNREIKNIIRLRDGETNLLVGLLKEEERRSWKGVVGLSNVPVLGGLFGATKKEIQQTDLVMAITPHIIRTLPMTPEDEKPVWVQLEGVATSSREVRGIEEEVPITAEELMERERRREQEPGIEEEAETEEEMVEEPGANEISLDPASIEIPQGREFRVSVNIRSQQEIGSLSLNISFDPQVVRIKDVVEGGLLRQLGDKVPFLKNIDNSSGNVTLGFSSPDLGRGFGGGGNFAIVVIEGLSSGETNLGVTGITASSTRSQVVNFLPRGCQVIVR